MRIIVTTDEGDVLVTEDIDDEELEDTDSNEASVYATGGTAALDARSILLARRRKEEDAAEERAEAMHGDHESALASVYGPND